MQENNLSLKEATNILRSLTLSRIKDTPNCPQRKKLQKALTIIQKNIQIIEFMQKGFTLQCQSSVFGIMSDIIQFHKIMAIKVNTHYIKYFIEKEGKQADAKFWNKAQKIISKDINYQDQIHILEEYIRNLKNSQEQNFSWLKIKIENKEFKTQIKDLVQKNKEYFNLHQKNIVKISELKKDNQKKETIIQQKNNVKRLEEDNQELKKKILEMQKRCESYESKIKTYKQKKNDFILQIEKYKKSIKNLQKQTEKQNNKIVELEKIICQSKENQKENKLQQKQQEKIQKQEKKEQISSLGSQKPQKNKKQEFHKNQKTQNKSKIQQIKKIKEIKSQLQKNKIIKYIREIVNFNKCKLANAKLRQIYKKIEETNRILCQKNLQLTKLKKQIQDNKKIKKQNEISVKEVINLLSRLNQEKKSLQWQKQKKVCQINELQLNRSEIFHQNKKLSEVEKVYQEYNKKIEEKSNYLERIKNLIKKQDEKYQKLQSKISKLSQQQLNKQQKIASYEKNLSKIEDLIKFQQLKKTDIQEIKDQSLHNYFLFGEILQNEVDRHYVTNILQKFQPNRKIIKTQLLFINRLMKDPHKTVDGVPSYIILIKFNNSLQNNKKYIVAMYSQKPLMKNNTLNNGSGFVSSVTNKKTYMSKNPNEKIYKFTQYSNDRFIFGCYQFVLHFQPAKLSIGLKMKPKFFEINDAKLQTFIGNQSSEIENYQVHQIFWQEQK